MDVIKVILLSMAICCVAGEHSNEETYVEARGKGKYALLTHLGFVLAAKVGLFKIVLAIALVVASIKTMVLLAWILAAFKYVPDLYPHYKNGFKYNHQYQQPPVHFFYVAATKLFILKVIYGVIFYVIVAKGWHLALWLIHYLKEKQPHEHYIEYDHDHEHHHDFSHHDHYSHHGYYDRVQDFAQDVPYSAHKPSYGKFENSYGKKVYDADGSYSVKNS
ncbi:uncharacterized protein [Epargyreus clarus]|uniref:uncharacterized protein n=1 Tax=Epargyreus clarus TaxID=520877 RepID=UPI003C2CE80D